MPDPTKPRCPCMHCRVRGAVGPVMLIAIGLIFLAGEYTRYGISDLWPVLLIVGGVLAVWQSTASRAGHTGT
jgi:uncharacterized membrane protein YqgA involved in biofilm formation